MEIYRDYRISHTAPNKGEEYDTSFNEIPYRKYLWTWEKGILKNIIDTYCKTPNNYLDFACGTGRIISYLEPMVRNAYGVDVSRSMLATARKKVKNASLINIDLTKEAYFPEGFFDLVTAFRFFQNAQEELRRDALLVTRKIIKDSGYFIFNIHNNSGSVKSYLKRIKHSIQGPMIKNHSFGLKDITRLSSDYGFKIIKTYHYGILPIKESTKLPMKYISSIENGASNFNFLKHLSNNIIFVCKCIDRNE